MMLSVSSVAFAAEMVCGEPLAISSAEDHDAIMRTLRPGALVVNATGMGKDRPGCPLTAHARFPDSSTAWDFNYRGSLRFLEYAHKQGTRAVDGWDYFLHGWAEIMARVFGFELTCGLFDAMRAEAQRRYAGISR